MAEWTAEYVGALPDSAFACIDPGGEKDEDGKTVPRSLRHYPHHRADGTLDLPHLRNALSRVAQDDTATCGVAHLRAHAKEAEVGEADNLAVKFADGSDNIIEGLAIPFGGPFGKGKDFDGEDFGPDTDIAADWFPSEGRPVLYHHGLDDALKTALVGRQIERQQTDAGHWVKVQLDKRNRYFERISQMVADEALSFSSGAIPHLVQARKDGHIERWPWVELSLTPTPANPLASVYSVKAADAIEHLAAVKAAIPSSLKEAIDESLDASLAGLSYADHADRVLADMQALVTRTQEIADLRAKAKRRLSAATRDRLTVVRDQAQQVIGDIDDLLVDAESEASKAARAEYLRFLRDELRANGVPV